MGGNSATLAGQLELDADVPAMPAGPAGAQSDAQVASKYIYWPAKVDYVHLIGRSGSGQLRAMRPNGRFQLAAQLASGPSSVVLAGNRPVGPPIVFTSQCVVGWPEDEPQRVGGGAIKAHQAPNCFVKLSLFRLLWWLLLALVLSLSLWRQHANLAHLRRVENSALAGVITAHSLTRAGSCHSSLAKLARTSISRLAWPVSELSVKSPNTRQHRLIG